MPQWPAYRPNKADALLDWAEETIPTFGKPRSTAQLRAKVCATKRRQVGLVPSDATCSVDDLTDLVATGTKFGCFYVDPPWPFENKRAFGGIGEYYDNLTIEGICALPVRELAADDAHLHLWVPNSLLEKAFIVLAAWGFEYKSLFVWCKPRDRPGPGHYWRNAHEVLLTAVRGDATRFNDGTLLSWGEYPRREHSRKPDEVRDVVRRASPGPYLELFARLQAEGWTTWGNQIAREDFLQAAE
jgi:N6-adenosine-specific RNA methylase IME4